MMGSEHTAQRVVQRLWRFCDVLRDDGLSYPDYVEQLTYLLFLKMADERSADQAQHLMPQAYCWSSLVSRRGRELHDHYGEILRHLSQGRGMLGLIFRNARNRIKDPAKLQKLVIDLINNETWSAHGVDVKGAAYEGLLDKTAQDIKSGAGQYFTPRPLIEACVDVIRPTYGERICDPAAGTAGFLLAAHKFILAHSSKRSGRARRFLECETYRGVELVDSVARLGAMNLFLHGIGGSCTPTTKLPISVEDSLATTPTEKYDVVLTNPPFGKKSAIPVHLESESLGAGDTVRRDFLVNSNNKQLNFLQHVLSLLKPGGRAAMVVPDNILFEAGSTERVRRYLLTECDLHTLLRLPTGIFYAQGVKANVIFFDRSPARGNGALWVYDLRTGLKFSLRTNPLTRQDLAHFVRCFSTENRGDRRELAGGSRPVRWRRYRHADLLHLDGCRLDIDWEVSNTRRGKTTSDLTAAIIEDLNAALGEMKIVARLLGK